MNELGSECLRGNGWWKVVGTNSMPRYFIALAYCKAG